MAESTALRAFLADLQAGGDPKLLVYDLDALAELHGEEREHAVALLIDRLEEADGRAAQTLAAAAIQEAVPALEQHTQHPDPGFRAAVNRALARLVRDDAATARVADDIAGGDPVQAAFSAFSLAEIDSPEAIRGLIAGLRAPFLPTRINSFRGLVKKLALEPYTEPIQAPLWAWYLLVGTELPSLVARGAEALEGFFTAVAQGRTPDELGLAYVPTDEDVVEQVWKSIQDESGDIDTAAVQRLGGDNRLWAENQIVNRLTWQDPRAADAAVELGLDWVLPALHEAKARFPWGKPNFLQALDAAIADFSGPASH